MRGRNNGYELGAEKKPVLSCTATLFVQLNEARNRKDGFIAGGVERIVISNVKLRRLETKRTRWCFLEIRTQILHSLN